MSPKPSVATHPAAPPEPCPSPQVRAWRSNLLDKLREWFAIEFHLVDGMTGELVHRAPDQDARDWLVRGELCRAVASRGKAELIEESPPLVVMALPVHGEHQQCVVAVGTFATSNSATIAQLAQAAELLGVAPEEAESWIAAQTPWAPDVLARMGQLATERMAAEWRLGTLDREVRELTLNLSTTYEEISLIYRLTQNLKLTSRGDELAALALEWLAEALPVESMAVQLEGAREGSQPTLLTFGPSLIRNEELREIVAQLAPSPGKRPIIVNRPTTSQEDWRWPQVHELVVVPLSEGSRSFGWLVAVNHSSGGEFGTVEASLLSSVAAILGIHSGNAELYEQQHELFKGVVRALTSAIDAKDPYTCGHSDRVARVAVRLAEEMHCDRNQIETVYISGLLHDVGKIGIDDDVLRKPGRLTTAEFEHIKTHTEIGHRILSDIKQLDDVLPVVLHHHEQWDGRGYPHGLVGDEIPLLARIVAVADSFDAMGSDRPYREGMPEEKLDAILRGGAGQQWDAEVVEAFFRARDDIRDIARKQVKNLSLEARQIT
ncbi:MAG: HD domain-containing protein [Planctomycetota bacterium]|nr:MAG: HD domain-containing protein [Planctomycetota bacterium]